MTASQNERVPQSPELIPTRASLLARLKDLGDNPSWREFFETYHRLIFNRVVQCGLSSQDAEDLVAEVVAGVARRMPDYVYDPKRCSFKTWLFRIVEYRIADHFRRRGRRLPSLDQDLSSDESEIVDPATLEPDKKWDEEWEQNMYKTALDRVRGHGSPRQLQLYLYSAVEGHSVAETALHLQAKPNEVSVARHRISKMLKTEIDQLRKREQSLNVTLTQVKSR